jgi:protoporphyrinogen oxidase
MEEGTKEQKHPFKILIVGAGLSGLSCALSLSKLLPSQFNFQISILEANNAS